MNSTDRGITGTPAGHNTITDALSLCTNKAKQIAQLQKELLSDSNTSPRIGIRERATTYSTSNGDRP